jgi:hypothetical protein
VITEDIIAHTPREAYFFTGSSRPNTHLIAQALAIAPENQSIEEC